MQANLTNTSKTMATGMSSQYLSKAIATGMNSQLSSKTMATGKNSDRSADKIQTTKQATNLNHKNLLTAFPQLKLPRTTSMIQMMMTLTLVIPVTDSYASHLRLVHR